MSWLSVCEKKGYNDNIRAKYIDLFANDMVDFFIRALKEHKREMVVDFFENTFDSLDEDYLYKTRFYFLRLATRSTKGDKLFLDTLSSYDNKKQELVLFQIKMDLECAIEIFMNGEFKQDWEHYS